MKRAGLLLALALLLSGCAWTNRANRPVWNAFEANLVPEGDGAFYATLPLTVPAGLVAILTDSFIVHPAQVADDAWDDAGDLWDNVPWQTEYYTQMAFLPLRVLGTPLVFVISFLGRSCFDIPPHGEFSIGRRMQHKDQEPADEAGSQAGDQDEDGAQREARRTAELLSVFRSVAGGSTRSTYAELDDPPPAWTDALQTAFDEALATGSAHGRLALYRYVRRYLPPARLDPALGLRDRDAVVRYEVLAGIGHPGRVPAEVRAALRDDPDEMVRELARSVWP